MFRQSIAVRRWACALGMVALAAPLSAAPRIIPRAPSVWLDDYTTAELKSRIDKGCPVVIVFSGGTEETGPYVALGKHAARIRAYGEAIARNVGDALIAPVLHYAPNPPYMTPFPGTISLRPEVFAAVNEDVARSLINGGFRRIALMSEHGPSQKPLADVAARLNAEFADKGAQVFYISDGYTRARREIEAAIRAEGKVGGGHGGLWDTSETLAVDPSLVRPGPYLPGTIDNDGNGPVNALGYSGDPTGANARIGHEFGAMRVRLASAELSAALKSAGACRRQESRK